MALWTLEKEIRYFAQQGWRLEKKYEAGFYASYYYEREDITAEEYFYIWETCPSGAVKYTFSFSTEEAARQHKMLPTSSSFTIYRTRAGHDTAAPLAHYYRDGGWSEARQYD